ncbi:hypothetical protein VB779_18860 [Haloarculaceae archaeon H-GB11]|nr:hypothetical protein [Haloarculaceae archaeon H-GB11]
MGLSEDRRRDLDGGDGTRPRDDRPRRRRASRDRDRRSAADGRAEASSRSYTELDGRLVRERLELDGQIGAWPASKRVSIELGSHPRADELRRLDVGTRALFRFAADATFTIHGGVPVDPGRSW